VVRKRVVADESNVGRQIYTREGGGMSNESKFIPNFLQVPNAVIDELLPDLTGAELKCYLVVIRKTKGWNKESDNISISQFMKATGLSNSAVIKACESLVKYGLLVKENGSRNTGVYAVNSYSKITHEKSSQVTCEESSPVKKVHSTYEKSSQVTCEKNSHTINNIKNTIQNTNKKTTQKNSLVLLAEFGIVGQLAEDFLKLRKAKSAPITETALKGFQREAAKAGISLSDAITIAIERNWRGFSASWNWRDDDIAMAANTRKTSSFADDGSWAVGRKLNIDPNLIPEELR
jgi:phage replication O-like protein O